MIQRDTEAAHAKALAEALRQVLRSLDTLDGESLSMLGRDALLEHVLGVVHDAGVDVARDELAAYDKDHDR